VANFLRENDKCQIGPGTESAKIETFDKQKTTATRKKLQSLG